MGKLPEGVPIAWVLGPDQKFIQIQPHQEVPHSCMNCSGFDCDDAEDGPPVLEYDPQHGTHTCVICGNPIEDEDVTVSLTRWMKPPKQKKRYPLIGGSRLAHFSCGVVDTLEFHKARDRHVRALQQVDRRLNSKMWTKSRKRFQSILMEETRKLIEEERELDAERNHLLRSYQRVERTRKGE